MNNFVLQISTFDKDGGQVIDETKTAAEVFSVESDGFIEVAFDSPDGTRVYVGFNLGHLTAAALHFALPDAA